MILAYSSGPSSLFPGPGSVGELEPRGQAGICFLSGSRALTKATPGLSPSLQQQ